VLQIYIISLTPPRDIGDFCKKGERVEIVERGKKG